jgi:hypothetical protein
MMRASDACCAEIHYASSALPASGESMTDKIAPEERRANAERLFKLDPAPAS